MMQNISLLLAILSLLIYGVLILAGPASTEDERRRRWEKWYFGPNWYGHKK